MGWIGLKTSSNTGAHNDWDSIFSLNRPSTSFASCKFTEGTSLSIGRPLIFAVPRVSYNTNPSLFWFDPKDSTTGKIKILIDHRSIYNYYPNHSY